MAKKQKQTVKPRSRGAAGEIIKRILGPLTRWKPNGMDVGMFWDELFHLSERSITFCKARRNFRMPGLYYEAPTVKIQGIGDRVVRKNSSIFIRTDTRRPGFVDIEIAEVDSSRVFSLTTMQLSEIRRNLEPCNYKVKQTNRKRAT